MKNFKIRYVEELERKCVVLENKCKDQQTVILKLLELLKKIEANKASIRRKNNV